MPANKWAKRRAKTLKSISDKDTDFRSKFEQTLSQQLTDAGLAWSYESVKIPYTVEKSYKVDFKLPNGILIEAKGYWLPADRTKHKLLREQHPELDIRFVFQNAHTKLRKGSSTTYAMWCDKHGFKWSHKTIPHEWLVE